MPPKRKTEKKTEEPEKGKKRNAGKEIKADKKTKQDGSENGEEPVKRSRKKANADGLEVNGGPSKKVPIVQEEMEAEEAPKGKVPKKPKAAASETKVSKATKATKAEDPEPEPPKAAKKKSAKEDEKDAATNKAEAKKPAVKKTKATKTKREKSEEDKPMNKTETDWESIDFTCTKKNPKGNTFNLKLSTWNIGGVKSWIKKACHEYLQHERPDIFCIQETKSNEETLPDEVTKIKDYKQYWCASTKNGYAGVGLFTLKEPISIAYGINDETLDEDGRCITAEYDKYYVVCVYVPNAGRKLVTLPKRLEWNKKFEQYISKLDAKKPVIICGDMNVSHQEMDLARPKSNTKSAGFTEEERNGMTEFLENGFVDTFRSLYPDQTDSYTFWTYLSNARRNNVGWRLDYFIVSKRIMDNVCDTVIRSEVFGSDHCPVTLFLNM